MDAAATALGKVGGTVTGAGREVVVTRDATGNFQLALTPAAIQQGIRTAVAQSIEIIRRRIDLMGTKEPDIRQQGADRIAIEAPGESDPQKLKDVVGQTAKLTFQMVDESVQAQDAHTIVPPDEIVLPDEGAQGHVPGGEAPGVGRQRRPLTHARRPRPERRVVSFRLNGPGSHRFGQVTTKHQLPLRDHPRQQGDRGAGDRAIRRPGPDLRHFTIDSANQLARCGSGALQRS
jgi:preprotein translocase subunit SecD